MTPIQHVESLAPKPPTMGDPSIFPKWVTNIYHPSDPKNFVSQPEKDDKELAIPDLPFSLPARAPPPVLETGGWGRKPSAQKRSSEAPETGWGSNRQDRTEGWGAVLPKRAKPTNATDLNLNDDSTTPSKDKGPPRALTLLMPSDSFRTLLLLQNFTTTL